MSELENRIVLKGLELGFTNIGFAEARDYPEYEEEVKSRPDYLPFTENSDSLLIRLARTKSLHPWAKSVVCATLGFSGMSYPPNMLRSVARIYLARIYSPQPGTVHRFQIDKLADCIEELGMRVERDQFCMPQRIACAEAGIVSLGKNNFAYTEEDGSFCLLVTFLVDQKLQNDGINLNEKRPDLGKHAHDRSQAHAAERTCRNSSPVGEGHEGSRFATSTENPSGKAVEKPGDLDCAGKCPDGCTRCMDACPTNAIASPCRLNLDRCILFNNQRFSPGAQDDIWDKMGMHIHGCDICQEACPRNRKALNQQKRIDPFLEMLSGKFDLEKMLALDDAYYDEVVNPIMYNYIKDKDIFRRNAAIALGNSGDASHLKALLAARRSASRTEVLEAIDWAIGKLSML